MNIKIKNYFNGFFAKVNNLILLISKIPVLLSALFIMGMLQFLFISNKTYSYSGWIGCSFSSYSKEEYIRFLGSIVRSDVHNEIASNVKISYPFGLPASTEFGFYLFYIMAGVLLINTIFGKKE